MEVAADASPSLSLICDVARSAEWGGGGVMPCVVWCGGMKRRR